MDKFLRFTTVFFILMSTGCQAHSWNCINRAAAFCNTWKMEVPGGWIVASDNGATGVEHGYAMVFVPDAGHTWN